MMRVISIPCLKDNYSYLVVDGTYAACVDPSEHTPVRAVIEREGITLRSIWLTHHHWDHVGGVDGLAAEGVEVVDASRCTLENDDLYSYRRQGEASGRLGGLIGVRP